MSNKGGEAMEQEKALLNAQEVMALLGCSEYRAYKVIRDTNEKLKAAGKLTIRGRVNRRYLMKLLDVEGL